MFDRDQNSFWQLYVFVADNIKIFLFFIFLLAFRTLKFFNFWKILKKRAISDMILSSSENLNLHIIIQTVHWTPLPSALMWHVLLSLKKSGLSPALQRQRWQFTGHTPRFLLSWNRSQIISVGAGTDEAYDYVYQSFEEDQIITAWCYFINVTCQNQVTFCIKWLTFSKSGRKLKTLLDVTDLNSNISELCKGSNASVISSVKTSQRTNLEERRWGTPSLI